MSQIRFYNRDPFPLKANFFSNNVIDKIVLIRSRMKPLLFLGRLGHCSLK